MHVPTARVPMCASLQWLRDKVRFLKLIVKGGVADEIDRHAVGVGEQENIAETGSADTCNTYF